LVEAVGVQVRARHAATNQRWGRVGWATDVYGLASRSLKVRRVVRRVGDQWIIHRAIDAEAQTSRDHEFAEPVSIEVADRQVFAVRVVAIVGKQQARHIARHGEYDDSSR